MPDRVTLFGNPFHLRLWGARAGRYKYLVSQAVQSGALYDLVADPGELTDISSTAPDIVRRLRARVGAVANAMATLYEERRFVPEQR